MVSFTGTRLWPFGLITFHAFCCRSSENEDAPLIALPILSALHRLSQFRRRRYCSRNSSPMNDRAMIVNRVSDELRVEKLFFS